MSKRIHFLISYLPYQIQKKLLNNSSPVSLIALLLFSITPLLSTAQTNIARSATIAQPLGGGSGIYGTQNYNDGIIPTLQSGTYGWVQSRGTIEFSWSSSKTLNKITLYKADRPIATCIVEYWDGTAFVTAARYTATSANPETITLAPSVTTTKLRLSSINGPTDNNPNFREIEIYDYVNSSPTNITLSASAIDERSPALSTVGSFSTSDVDAGDTFTYSLVSGEGDTDNELFSISGNELKINESPDFKTKASYSILVKSTDHANLTYTKQFIIQVNQVPLLPIVSTDTYQQLTSSSVLLGGNVSSDNGKSVTSKGVVWSTNVNPTVADNKVEMGTGTGIFSQTLASLSPKTTIYVRAYATNSEGTAYGSEISFKTKDVQAITYDALNDKTYGDTDFDPGATSDSGLPVSYSSDNVSVATIVNGKVHIAGVGTATITAAQTGNESYDAAKSKDQTLTVKKKALTVTAGNKSKYYGDNNPELTVTYKGLANEETALNPAPAVSTTATTLSEVGTYDITVTGEASNYELTFEKATLTVNKKAVTVTAVAKSKIYGDADPALTYNITTGALVGTDVFTGSLTRDAGESAGTYAIKQGTLALSDNYTLTYAGDNLTINKKTVTVTASAKSKTFGDSDPALTYDISSGALVGTDAFTGSLTRDAGENVGTYAIKQGTLALSDNYTLTYAGDNLAINRKAVTVTAAARSKTYGDSDPALIYSISSGGLVGADAFTGNLTRDAGENVGSYAIKQGTLALSGNYALTFAGDNLTISKKAITVTAVAKNKTYGDADPALTYIFSPALTGSDSFSGSLTRDAGEDVGTYAIKQGTLALSSNYTLSYTGDNLMINKKAVAVTAVAKGKTYGDADPALTYNITTGALVGTDAFSGSLTRDTGENIGIYAIKQGTLALSSNYTLSYTGDNLTINRKSLTVTVNNQSKTYGDPNPVLTVTYSGLVNGETALNPAPNVTTAVTAATGIGNYDITASGTAANYTVTYVKGTLAVNKKALTITADNKEKFQGLALPTFTASYTGFVNNETNSILTTQPSFATTANAMSPQGTYPITVSGATAANYAITFVPGVLTVKPGYPTSISLAATTLYENAPVGTLAGTLSSTSDDPSAAFTYSLVSGTGSTDNASFKISGNQLQTNAVLNFESKASYSVLVRSTTQYGLSLDKQCTIILNNVNEQPTLNNIAAQTICYTPAQQTVALGGITAGEDANQTTTVSVSSTNNNLFKSLTVTQASNGNAQVRYTVADGASGSAVVNVMVTDNGGTANGGINTMLKSFVLNVNALPVPTITTDKGVSNISKGDVLVLKAEGGTSYQWSNANGILSGQNTQNLTIRPDATTTYQVTVTNASGCSETKDITIEVTEDYVMLKGSNLISPNGDGVNDVFKIDNIDMYPNNTVKIFDRAGRLLFSKKDYSKDGEWNGTLNGAPLTEDTYYYVVDFGPNRPKLTGFITIVRD